MSSHELLFAKVRDDFPMLQKKIHGHPFVYLDNAATSLKPMVVIDAITNFYKHEYGTVHRAVYETCVVAGDKYQKARRTAARFLNAKSEDEIIFTKGTTEGVNLVAHSFGKAFIREGDEILITEMEHHSNIVPWQMCAEERGAILKVVPFFDNGELDLEAFQSLLSERTKIVALCHISNALGTINPIQEIVKLARSVGAKVFVDGAQSAPHLEIDVQALDVDFYAFSGHKTVGPTGIGVLYGKHELLQAMPPYQGGGDMIETVTFEKTTYNTVPLKFEAGTPMVAQVIGLGAALDYLLTLGKEKIHAWENELLDRLWSRIHEIPQVKVLGTNKERGALVTFTVDGVHPLDIATLLDLQGIAIRTGHLCTQPIMRHFGLEGGVSRASLSFYNTKSEIDFFADSLTKAIKQLK